MKLRSIEAKFVKEYDSSNGGTKSMIPISDFIELPVDIPDVAETKIYRCYDENKKLLGEIRPKKGDKTITIQFKNY